MHPAVRVPSLRHNVQLTVIQLATFQLPISTPCQWHTLSNNPALNVELWPFLGLVIYSMTLFWCWAVATSHSSQSAVHHTGRQPRPPSELWCPVGIFRRLHICNACSTWHIPTYSAVTEIQSCGKSWHICLLDKNQRVLNNLNETSSYRNYQG